MRKKLRKSWSWPKPFGGCPWSYWLANWGIVTPWGIWLPLHGLSHRYHLWQIGRVYQHRKGVIYPHEIGIYTPKK